MSDPEKPIVEEQERKVPFFSKETTSVIKGVAIILMFIHHFWGFPEWILPEYGGTSYENLSFLRFPVKICVLIFCFLSGYFYYFSKEKTYAYSLRKIRGIFTRYWICLFLLGAVGIFYFDHYYDAASVVKELLALQSTTIRFNWYVAFYFVCMMLAPLLVRFLKKKPIPEAVVYFLVLPLLFQGIFQWIQVEFLSEFFLHCSIWLPAFYSGFMFAEYSVLEKIEARYKKLITSRACQVLVAAVMLPALMVMNASAHIYFNLTFDPDDLWILLDFIIMPLEMFFLVELCKLISARTKTAKLILSALGKESTLMWFLHSAFFTYEKPLFQPLAYFTGVPVLSLIIGLGLTFIVAFVLRMLIDKCEAICRVAMIRSKQD